MTRLSLLSIFSLFLLNACASLDASQKQIDDQSAAIDDQSKKIESDAAAAVDPVAKAKEIYASRCVACHGASGKGDGPAAAALNPKPKDYTNPTWKTSVNDSMLAKAIVGGGSAVGKSALMPANADLASQPAVVAELVKIIRAF